MLLSTCVFLSVALSGCMPKADAPPPAQPKIDQSKICAFADDSQAKKCSEGELALFQPKSWGSEQLPLNVAAVYCDFNYPVMHNNAGLLCVFTKKRMHLL